MSAVNIHASCVMLDKAASIFGAAPGDGVLILGASGAGKSSVALKLLAMGARLDSRRSRANCSSRNSCVRARAPASLAGLLERVASAS